MISREKKLEKFFSSDWDFIFLLRITEKILFRCLAFIQALMLEKLMRAVQILIVGNYFSQCLSNTFA
jgi:hypothetical protein